MCTKFGEMSQYDQHWQTSLSMRRYLYLYMFLIVILHKCHLVKFWLLQIGWDKMFFLFFCFFLEECTKSLLCFTAFTGAARVVTASTLLFYWSTGEINVSRQSEKHISGAFMLLVSHKESQGWMNENDDLCLSVQTLEWALVWGPCIYIPC